MLKRQTKSATPLRLRARQYHERLLKLSDELNSLERFGDIETEELAWADISSWLGTSSSSIDFWLSNLPGFDATRNRLRTQFQCFVARRDKKRGSEFEQRASTGQVHERQIATLIGPEIASFRLALEYAHQDVPAKVAFIGCGSCPGSMAALLAEDGLVRFGIAIDCDVGAAASAVHQLGVRFGSRAAVMLSRGEHFDCEEFDAVFVAAYTSPKLQIASAIAARLKSGSVLVVRNPTGLGSLLVDDLPVKTAVQGLDLYLLESIRHPQLGLRTDFYRKGPAENA